MILKLISNSLSLNKENRDSGGVWIKILVDFHIFISSFSPCDTCDIYKHVEMVETGQKDSTECHGINSGNVVKYGLS